jgi:myo-inositol-1(or 4)-monophosphatase
LATSSLLPIFKQARAWIEEAGQNLRQSIRSEIHVEYKTSIADLVTDKDREIERFFIDHIRQKYPSHQILAEEGVNGEKLTHPDRGWVWIIDPIDGTTNFVHQKCHFCISVALYYQGKPQLGLVYDPVVDELFYAISGQGAYLNDQPMGKLEQRPIEEAVISINSLWLTPNRYFDYRPLQALVGAVRGSRNLGSAALELSYVACGRLDAYFAMRLSPWDFGAGLFIAQEAGALASTIENQPIQVFEKSSIFVARPGLHQAIVDKFLTASPSFQHKSAPN